MQSNEDEYIDRVLSKFNTRLSNRTTPVQPKKSKKDLMDMQNDLTELRNKLNEQSGYILEMTKNRDDISYIEKIRKDNMLLYQTNEELRLIIRELQIKLNDMENDRRTGSKGTSDKNGFKSNRDLIALETVRSEERERASQLLDKKNEEVNEIRAELKEYKKFIDQLKEKIGLKTEGSNIDEFVMVFAQANQKVELLERQMKTTQQNKENADAYIDKLTQELNSKNTEFSRIEEDNNSLRNKLMSIEDNIAQLNNQLNRKDIIEREIRDENNRIKDINNNLSAKILELQNREASDKQTSTDINYRIRALEDQNQQLIRNFENKESQFKEKTHKLEDEVGQLRIMLKEAQNQPREPRVYNAPSSFTTSNVDSLNQGYKPLYEKLAEEKRKTDEELRTIKMKYDNEMRALDINNRNLQNEKTYYTERANKLQSDYDKLYKDFSDLKASQWKNQYNTSKVDETEIIRLKNDISKLTQENSQIKATLDFYQKDNERLKRELNEVKTKQERTSVYREAPLSNNIKVKDFQTTLQTCIAEKEQQLKEAKLSTPCKIYQVQTRYDKSPNITRYISPDVKRIIHSGQKETQVNFVDIPDSYLKEIEYLRSEISRLNQRIHELTDTNNQQVERISSLSQQLNETKRNSVRNY